MQHVHGRCTWVYELQQVACHCLRLPLTNVCRMSWRERHRVQLLLRGIYSNWNYSNENHDNDKNCTYFYLNNNCVIMSQVWMLEAKYTLSSVSHILPYSWRVITSQLFSYQVFKAISQSCKKWLLALSCLFFCLSQLLLDGFSLNLMFEYFSEIKFY
jgi:hypothetical protein